MFTDKILGWLLAFRAWSHPLRSLALSRLHRLSRVTVYSPAHHGRQVLFGQDRGQVPGMEDGQQGDSHDSHDLEHTGHPLFCINIRMGAFHWKKRFGELKTI